MGLIKATLEDSAISSYVMNGEIKGHYRAPLAKAGYIPIVSTLTGGVRTLLGLIHTIESLAYAIFDRQNREAHLKDVSLGSKNIARGLLETIPFIGNLIVILIDIQMINETEEGLKKDIENHKDFYQNTTVRFFDGEFSKQTKKTV